MGLLRFTSKKNKEKKKSFFFINTDSELVVRSKKNEILSSDSVSIILSMYKNFPGFQIFHRLV